MKKLLWLALVCCCIVACNSNSSVTPLPPTPTPIVFTHIHQGLEGVKSYQTHMIIEYNGKHQNESVAGRVQILDKTEVPNLFYHYMRADISRSRYNLPIGISEFLRVGSSVYFKQPIEPYWFLMSSPALRPIDLNLFDFNHLIILPHELSGLPQIEQFNQQTVRHYQFTEVDINNPDIELGGTEGHIWVSDQENYIVQYVMSTTLKMVMPDPNTDLISQGFLHLRYSLTDINQPITVTIPAVGNPELLALPRLEEAKFITSLANLLEYTAPVTPALATRFYRETIPPLGWEEMNASVHEVKARLVFNKESEILTIFITPEINQVKILVTKGDNP